MGPLPTRPTPMATRLRPSVETGDRTLLCPARRVLPRAECPGWTE
jgi:hypothetical protein